MLLRYLTQVYDADLFGTNITGQYYSNPLIYASIYTHFFDRFGIFNTHFVEKPKLKTYFHGPQNVAKRVS